VKEILPVIGWSAAKDTHSAADGMKALSHSNDGSLSAHNKEFVI
jgi:hypothetical protein